MLYKSLSSPFFATLLKLQKVVSFLMQCVFCRRHYVKFPPGALDKHYEKLLQCDKRLFELSKRSFPGFASPYFYSNIYGDTDVSFDFRAFQSQVPHGLQQRSFAAIPSPLVPPRSVHNLRLPTGQPITIVDSNSPMSGMYMEVVSSIGSEVFDVPKHTCFSHKFVGPSYLWKTQVNRIDFYLSHKISFSESTKLIYLFF